MCVMVSRRSCDPPVLVTPCGRLLNTGVATTPADPDPIAEAVLHGPGRVVPPLAPFTLDADDAREDRYPAPVPLTHPAILEDLAKKASTVPTPSSLPVTDGAG